MYLTNGGAGYGAIDPANYSNNGTLTSVGAGSWSIQRVFYFPNSVAKAIVVYYGNATYATEAEAIANINIESFVEAPNTAANAVYLGAIVISGNGTFANTNTFKIVPGGLFRAVGGSGGGGSVVTQTLTGLSDVAISGPTNLQPFAYSNTAGKWINTSILSASIVGNATTATSASYAATSSWAIDAINATTASYVTLAQTASYVAFAQSASFVSGAVYTTGNQSIDGLKTFITNTSFNNHVLLEGSGSDNYMVAWKQRTAVGSALLNPGNGYTGIGAFDNYRLQFYFNQGGSSAKSFAFNIGNVPLNSIVGLNIPATGGDLLVSNLLTGSVATASLALTAQTAQTASYVQVAQTASYVLNAQTASYVVLAQTASYVALAQTASYVQNAQTASYVVLAQTASYVALAESASYVANAQTASYVLNAVSSSFALTASYALNGGSGGLSALYIQDEGITQGTASYLNFTGTGVTTTVTAGTASISISGGGGTGAGQSVLFTQASPALTWSFNHNLNNQYVSYDVYDSGSNAIIPANVSASSANTLIITFAVATAGYAVATVGGGLPFISASFDGYVLTASGSVAAWAPTSSFNAVSASYAVSASFAQTASYVLNAVSSSFAATSSYSNNISGTTSYIPKFTGGNSLGNSIIFENATGIGINDTSPTHEFQVSGDAFIYNSNSTLNLTKYGLLPALNLTTTGTESNQYANVSIYGSFGYSATTGTFTPSDKSFVGSFLGQVSKSGGASVSGKMSSFAAGTNLSGAGNTTTIAGFRAYAPLQSFALPSFSGVLTNYIGLLIDDITGTTDVGSQITNKYGIYQSGSLDKNFFAGSTTFANGITGSISGSASFATSASYALTASFAPGSGTAVSASYALSASFATTAATASFATNFTASNILATGTITAQTLVVQTVTSSIVYSSGSNIFGNNLNNTQQLTGSVTITGSLQVNGRTPLYTDQTASLTVLSASYAATASHANASAVTPFTIGGTSIYYGTVNSSIVGSNNVFTIPTASFTAAKFIYTVSNGTNARSGEIMAVWNAGTAAFTDASTVDIGSTTPVTASVSIVSAQAQLNFQTNTSGWVIKSQATFL